jgi:hypothetical protein
VLRSDLQPEGVYVFTDKIESGVHFYENEDGTLRFTPSVFSVTLNPRESYGVSILCTLSSDKWPEFYILKAVA